MFSGMWVPEMLYQNEENMGLIWWWTSTASLQMQKFVVGCSISGGQSPQPAWPQTVRMLSVDEGRSNYGSENSPEDTVSCFLSEKTGVGTWVLFHLKYSCSVSLQLQPWVSSPALLSHAFLKTMLFQHRAGRWFWTARAKTVLGNVMNRLFAHWVIHV